MRRGEAETGAPGGGGRALRESVTSGLIRHGGGGGGGCQSLLGRIGCDVEGNEAVQRAPHCERHGGAVQKPVGDAALQVDGGAIRDLWQAEEWAGVERDRKKERPGGEKSLMRPLYDYIELTVFSARLFSFFPVLDK